MKISIYMYLRNGISMDFHVEAMLRHHLPLADEIVVNEGYSDDDTYERIRQIDSKVKVHRRRWDDVKPGLSWWCCLGDQARRDCTGDWCIKLDADEFIPEWEFGRIRRLLAETNEDLLPMRFKNFYANFKVLNARPERSRWPVWKYIIHRNLPSVQIVGDGSSVRLGSQPWAPVPDDAIELHHFGAVRDAARLRQKWRNDGAMKAKRAHFDSVPLFVYRLMPHDWFDREFIDDLSVYEGPFVKAVVDDPGEFIRDGMKVYEWLKARPQ